MKQEGGVGVGRTVRLLAKIDGERKTGALVAGGGREGKTEKEK